MKKLLLVFAWTGLCVFADLALQLPPCIYAVSGQETNIYFDNIVLAINPDNYVFDVTCAKGVNEARRWTFTPTNEDAGTTFDWKLNVISDKGVVASGSTKVIVSRADAGAGRKVSVLIVGDSLTHAGVYPARIFALFKQPGNPALKMFGSNGPGYKPQPDGVAHEGWGGWRWSTFVTKGTAPNVPNPMPNQIASRFLVKKDGKFVLDLTNYFKQYGDGNPPDFITFQLGVNDVFGATDDNLQGNIKEILGYAKKLVEAARRDAPDAFIGVGLTTPGAKSQDAFGKNYNCGQTRWQYKKNQHALNQAMLDAFKANKDPKLFIVATNINLDCENNFPVTKYSVNKGNKDTVMRQCNGVHPSAAGYNQIGDTFYAWMKYCLDSKPAK